MSKSWRSSSCSDSSGHSLSSSVGGVGDRGAYRYDDAGAAWIEAGPMAAGGRRIGGFGEEIRSIQKQTSIDSVCLFLSLAGLSISWSVGKPAGV